MLFISNILLIFIQCESSLLKKTCTSESFAEIKMTTNQPFQQTQLTMQNIKRKSRHQCVRRSKTTKKPKNNRAQLFPSSQLRRYSFHFNFLLTFSTTANYVHLISHILFHISTYLFLLPFPLIFPPPPSSPSSPCLHLCCHFLPSCSLSEIWRL